MIPIAIRTFERPFFLDITLKSLLASKIDQNQEIIIFDDCSQSEEANDYLFTNKEINIKNPIININFWETYVGQKQTHIKIVGLNNKITIIRPNKRKGVRGFIFWIINYMMENFPEADRIHIIEADCVFNENWYLLSKKYYDDYKTIKNKNGDHIGLLSCYDRKCNKPDVSPGFRFRVVEKKDHTYNFSNGIGGVHYLISRELYNRATPSFTKEYYIHSKSGDTELQSVCLNNNCTISVTAPSLIQHIGIESTAWPNKGWRYCKGFLKPYSWKDSI